MVRTGKEKPRPANRAGLGGGALQLPLRLPGRRDQIAL